MAGDLDLKALWLQQTGQVLPEGIHSPFNACMYRETCQKTQAELQALRDGGSPISEDKREELEALADAAFKAHKQILADAARYRWLRDKQATYDLTQDDDRLTLIRFVTEIFPHDDESMTDAIDAGIDEKMAAG